MADTGGGARPAGSVVCPVALCPVGMLMTTANQLRPEVVEPLLKAGRELMLAVSAIMNARAEAAGSSRLEHIEVE